MTKQIQDFLNNWIETLDTCKLFGVARPEPLFSSLGRPRQPNITWS